MLDITSTSTLLDFHELPSGSKYYIANNTIVFFDMNKNTVKDVIAMLDSGELDNFPLMSVYLFDFYAKPEKLAEGFGKLFDYLIFDNQWFLEHDISIVCTTQDMYELISTVAESSQRTITATEELWPVINKNFLDILDLSDTVKGMIRLSEGTESPHESIRIILSLTKEYVETRLTEKEAGKSKSITIPADGTAPNYPSFTISSEEEADGYEKDNSEPEGGIYSGDLEIVELVEETTSSESSDTESAQPTTATADLYHVHYIQHHILTMETNFLVARFYGKSSLSMSAERPNGTVVFDVSNILKKSKIYLTPDDITKLEAKVKSKGGELNNGSS